ncbi:MAG: hypothetical protein ACLTAO_03425, partial [Christensenellales bacterium]
YRPAVMPAGPPPIIIISSMLVLHFSQSNRRSSKSTDFQFINLRISVRTARRLVIYIIPYNRAYKQRGFAKAVLCQFIPDNPFSLTFAADLHYNFIASCCEIFSKEKAI